MGHMRIVVIGKNVEEQMAPYRNFKKSGADVNQYVVSVDILDEKKRRWAEDESDYTYAQDAEGKLHDIYKVGFWRNKVVDDASNSEQTPMTSELLSSDTIVEIKGKKPKKIRTTLNLPPEYKAVKLKRRDAVSFIDSECSDYLGSILEEGQMPDLHGKHKFGWMRLDKNGEVIELIMRTIPDSF